jgi:hypothetical protein
MTDTYKVNKRKWHRQPVRLLAHYFVKYRGDRFNICTIVRLSRNGAGVVFPPDGPVHKNDPVFFEIVMPRTFQPINIKGQVKNTTSIGDDIVTGVKFDDLLPENMFARLV